MKPIDINTTLIEGYLRLLDNLSPGNKLDLISKLTLSVKTDITNRKKAFYKAYGAWDSEKSADEIIAQIRNSRTSNRQTEQFWKNISLIQTFVSTTSKESLISRKDLRQWTRLTATSRKSPLRNSNLELRTVGKRIRIKKHWTIFWREWRLFLFFIPWIYMQKKKQDYENWEQLSTILTFWLEQRQ